MTDEELKNDQIELRLQKLTENRSKRMNKDKSQKSFNLPMRKFDIEN